MADIAFTGGKTFFLIAGPCVIESEEHVLRMARAIQAVGRRVLRAVGCNAVRSCCVGLRPA